MNMNHHDNPDAAIDAATFKELQDTTDTEFVAELIEAFLTDAPVLLKTLHATHASGDAAGFKRAAHSLKSNGNTFGAFAFSALARELEETGLVALGANAPDALARLEAAYGQVTRALEERRRG
jgi:HPt (histidine-containing phosphotransfer) domain-containing protein